MHGPGDLHFLPGIARAIRRHRIVPASGRATTSVIHVEDLAEIIARLAVEPARGDSVFHATDGAPLTIRALFERVAAAIDHPAPRFALVPSGLLYLGVRAHEVATGRDPEAGQGGLTSLRVRFLTRHASFSNAALRQRFPDLVLRTLADGVSVD